MAYSYQKSFFEPTQDVSHDLLIGLLRDHNNAHKVDLIRQIKTTAATCDWTVEREYQQWFQQLKAKQRQDVVVHQASEYIVVIQGVEHISQSIVLPFEG